MRLITGILLLYPVFFISQNLFAIDMMDVDGPEAQVVPSDWPRIRESITDAEIKTSIIDLIAEYKTRNLNDAQKYIISDIENRRDSLHGNELVWQYWRFLYLLRDLVERDSNEYVLLYGAMSKLLLAREVFPSDYYNDESLIEIKALYQFLNPLIENLERLDRNFQGENDNNGCAVKEKTWIKRYLAQLLTYKARYFLPCVSFEWSQSLHSAAQHFMSMMDKSVTKTVYLLLAELIVDYGVMPAEMSSHEAKAYADELIKKALYEKQESAHKASSHGSHVSALIKASRPQYMHKLHFAQLERQNSEPDVVESAHADADRRDQLEANDENNVDNSVVLYPYRELSISLLENDDAEQLPVNKHVRNPVESVKRRAFIYQDRWFDRLNVSAENFNCFFNSIGATRNGGAQLLIANINDNTVRSFIANEIVNIAIEMEGQIIGTPRLDDEMQEAIGFLQFKNEIMQINALEERRNEIMQASSEALPDELTVANINQRRSHAVQALHARAARVKSCKLYIDKYVRPNGIMINFEPTLDDVVYPRHFTVVDAIAYARKIGLRIYQRDTNIAANTKRLKLTHNFIPENARKIAHIFWEGNHFQTMKFSEPRHVTNFQIPELPIDRERGVSHEFWENQTDNILKMVESLPNYAIIVNGKEYKISEDRSQLESRIWRTVAEVYGYQVCYFRRLMSNLGLLSLSSGRLVWTDERIEELRRYAQQGMGKTEIANIMRTNSGYLSLIAGREGISFVPKAKKLREKITENEIVKAIQLHCEEKKTITEIARILGKDPSVISAALQNKKVRKKQKFKPWTLERLETLKKLYKEGWVIADISLELGVHYNTVLHKLQNMPWYIKRNTRNKRKRDENGEKSRNHDAIKRARHT